MVSDFVLNLIITGIPSIPLKKIKEYGLSLEVLNLIITGIPSIQKISRRPIH